MTDTESIARRKPRFRERNAIKQPKPPTPRKSATPPPLALPRVQPLPRVRVVGVPSITREQALYAGLLLLGGALRLWDVGSRAMHGDESVHAWFAWNLFKGSGYQYDPVYHGPLQFLVTSVFFFLFGVSNVTARLMAVLFGIALIGLPYFLRRWIGRPAALLGATFIAVSPAFVYVSRLERDDIFTSFFALSMAISLFSYVATRRSLFLYLFAASAALSLAAMENTYITLFVFGSFVLLVLASELLSRSSRKERYAALWNRTGSSGLIGWRWLAIPGGLLLAAFALTVTTGLYLPVPLVLALSIAALVLRQSFFEASESERTPFLDALCSISGQQWLNMATIVVAILFLTFSTFGTNLRGIWDSAQPFFNSGHACPNNPFPLNPCRKDMIGGLFYWLSQHRVHRGGQPWFYYSLLFGLYEQIALVLGFAGIVWFTHRPNLFRSFLIYWALLMFGVYAWAGEKFSWLMIHPLLPFLLLAAMFVVTMVQSGRIVRLTVLGVTSLLLLLELHSMFEVNFVYGADPVEMMVYVQSSPDTPRVAADILSISNKVTSGNDLHVAIDSLDTWPFAWYLRDMTNISYPAYPQLAKPPFITNPVILVDETNQAVIDPKLRSQYSRQRYRLRWWFPEDYKNLTWSSFGADLKDPGYWRVVAAWLFQRRPFGPKGSVWFYYYVKKGLVSPY